MHFPVTIDEQVEVTVKGIGGRVILQKQVSAKANEHIPLEINTQAAGIYFIEVKTVHVRFSKKLIIHEGHKHLWKIVFYCERYVYFCIEAVGDKVIDCLSFSICSWLILKFIDMFALSLSLISK